MVGEDSGASSLHSDSLDTLDSLEATFMMGLVVQIGAGGSGLVSSGLDSLLEVFGLESLIKRC